MFRMEGEFSAVLEKTGGLRKEFAQRMGRHLAMYVKDFGLGKIKDNEEMWEGVLRRMERMESEFEVPYLDRKGLRSSLTLSMEGIDTKLQEMKDLLNDIKRARVDHSEHGSVLGDYDEDGRASSRASNSSGWETPVGKEKPRASSKRGTTPGVSSESAWDAYVKAQRELENKESSEPTSTASFTNWLGGIAGGEKGYQPPVNPYYYPSTFASMTPNPPNSEKGKDKTGTDQAGDQGKPPASPGAGSSSSSSKAPPPAFKITNSGAKLFVPKK